MTKEPIMIDDVDVAECQYLYFAIEDSIIDYKEYPRCSIGEAFTNNACKNSNCYYKQLKRKEEECERLKKEIDIKSCANIELSLELKKYENAINKIEEIAYNNCEISEMEQIIMIIGGLDV